MDPEASTRLVVLAAALSVAACDRARDPGASPQVRGPEAVEPAVASPTATQPAAPVTEGPRDAPVGQWSVQDHHPRLHQLDQRAWAELTLELLSGVVETQAEVDGLRLRHVGGGSVAGQIGLLPGDVLLAVGSARPPSPASLHDAWALGARTQWVELERRREDSTETAHLWITPRASPQSVAAALVRLGVVRQDEHRRLIDRALLQTLAETPWLHRYAELWQSLGVPSRGSVLRVDQTNVGTGGAEGASDTEIALELLAARAEQRAFEVGVGTDDGEIRLQYEVLEGLLDSETLAQIRDTPAPQSRRRPSPLPSTTSFDDGIEKKGENHYRIDREWLDEVLADPATLARAARVIPSSKDGAIEGFKLYGIRRSSVLSALGLQNGDLLLSIQGHELRSVDDAMEAYVEVSTSKATTLRVGIVRRGEEIEMTFDIE